MIQVKHLTIGQGRPKICVPLTGKTKEELLQQANSIRQSHADIVEWRVDYFSRVNQLEEVLETLIELRERLGDKILLFTFRSLEEGGEKELSLHEYKELYLAVANSGKVEMVDIELKRAEFLGRGFLATLKQYDTVLLMSRHHFDETPRDEVLIFETSMMRQFGADIGKIATMPEKLADVLRMMNLATKSKTFNPLPLVVIAMGDIGKITRVAGELIDSVMTFGIVEEASAPGQIPLEQLDQALDILSLNIEF